MGRNTRSNVTGFHIRAKLFKKIVSEDSSKYFHSLIPIIFYAKDHTNFVLIRNPIGEVIGRQAINGYICTKDLKPGEVSTGDKVEYDGITYEVTGVEFIDSNRQKEVLRRNIETLTVIKLE